MRSVAKYAQQKEHAARARGGDDLVLGILKAHLEHPESLPSSLLRKSPNDQITHEQWVEAKQKINSKASELDRRLNGPSNYKALWWRAVNKTVSGMLIEKEYNIPGEEIGLITESLAFKGDYGVWLKPENGTTPNRYGQLLDRLSDQVRSQSEDGVIDDDAVYALVVSWREKRRLRRALKHAYYHHDSIVENEVPHQKRIRFNTTKLTPSDTESVEIQAATRDRVQQNGAQVLNTLMRFGYAKPDYYYRHFGLK